MEREEPWPGTRRDRLFDSFAVLNVRRVTGTSLRRTKLDVRTVDDDVPGAACKSLAAFPVPVEDRL